MQHRSNHRRTLRVAGWFAWLVIAMAARGATEIAVSPGATVTDRADAERRLDEGDAAVAAEMFSSLLERNPDDADSAAGRVRALLALDRWPEAIVEATALRERIPGRAVLDTAFAESLVRGGRLAMAEPVLERLCSADAPPPRGLIALARLRAARGRGEEARKLVASAVRDRGVDRYVLFWAAELTDSRSAAIGFLERYLDLSEGDDPDRIEAARGSLRVLRELGDRQVWVPVERPERVELPLTPLVSNAGTLLGYVVKARIGPKRKPVPLLLDTGSGGLFLVHRVARKRGFEPLAEETTFGGGGEKRHPSRRGLFSSFEVGGLKFADALATTTEHDLEPQGRYQGVLGLSRFDGYRVVLDLRKGRLVLDPGGNEADGVPYWTFSGQMLVRASVPDGESGLFLFDTGATSSILSARFAEGISGVRWSDPATVRGFGGLVGGARTVRGAAVTFQGLSTTGDLRAIDLGLRSRLGGVEICGYLGLDVLRDARIVIDTRGRRLSVQASD